MAGRMAGKVAFVTGGNVGIGEAIVHRLAQEGAAVAIVARREEEGRAVERSVRKAGGEAQFVACDVMERSHIEAAVVRTVERFGGLHVVVNNAGGMKPPQFHGIDRVNDAAWHDVLDLNLTSAYIVSQAAWPHLVAATGSSIVNISSTAAVGAWSPSQQESLGGVVPPAYWAAKAGLEALTRYLASVGAKHGIRANCVRPGQILTPGVRTYREGRHTFGVVWDQMQLVPGHGEPADIAAAVAFLAADESRFISGQVVNVDGGSITKIQ
jgi:NAD(P)-dependent dehydrogenase (short-subunit alcohol dehydrogenase family)